MRKWLTALGAVIGLVPAAAMAAQALPPPPAQAPAAAAPIAVKPAAPAPLALPPPPSPEPVRKVTAFTPHDPPVVAGSAAPGANAEAKKNVLSFRAGALRSTETFTDPAVLGAFSVGFARTVRERTAVGVEGSLRLSQQPYQGLQPDATGKLLRADLSEQRYEIGLNGSYDAGAAILDDGRLLLAPGLGVRYATLRNGAFDSEVLGPDLRLRGRFLLSPSVAVFAQAGWVMNLLKNRLVSAVGPPLWDLALSGGISLPLSGGFGLELGYQGDVLALLQDRRVAHGASLGLIANF